MPGIEFSGSSEIERQITEWRAFLRRQPAIQSTDVEELEGHLRDQIAALTQAGLAADEAFLIGVKRLGRLDALSREFAHEYSERLWKRLVLARDDGEGAARPIETLVVWALAFTAALAIKIPALFGLELGGGDEAFYARNVSFFVLPPLTVYFVWKRGLPRTGILRIALPFLVAAVLANLFPFTSGSDTEMLMALHLPIALWLVVGFAYVGGHGFTGTERMNFVRFSGELAIYYVLIALGGGVLTGLTVQMFNTIGADVEWLAEGWLIPCGAMGAVIVGSWLVEAKQSVIENMAPVLTRLFTPLFAIAFLAFLGTMAWTGTAIDAEREVLIAFDLSLALVVGLVLYAASAREADSPPGLFDGMQLVLVLSALLVDAVALTAIAGRISEFGFTPNRVAALGENLVLLVNLLVTAVLYGRLLLRGGTFALVERWQTAYLPVYAVWAAIVVVLFPPLFGYR